MATNIARSSRSKSLVVECATGLYGGLGGIHLAIWMILSYLSLPLQRFYDTVRSTWPLCHLQPVEGLILWLVRAMLVALWLDFALAGRKRWARLSAALLLAAFIIYSSFLVHIGSREPISGWSIPTTRAIPTAILTILTVALLPVLPRFSRPATRPLRRFTRVLLYLLPLLAILPVWGLNVAIRVDGRAQTQRVQQVDLPLPPEAMQIHTKHVFLGKVIEFTLKERYPSTAAVQFYDRYFLANGWNRGQQYGWERGPGYTQRGKHATMHYIQEWHSSDGELLCSLLIMYETPWGIDPDLPLSQWEDDWLEIQQVRMGLGVAAEKMPWPLGLPSH